MNPSALPVAHPYFPGANKTQMNNAGSGPTRIHKVAQPKHALNPGLRGASAGSLHVPAPPMPAPPARDTIANPAHAPSVLLVTLLNIVVPVFAVAALGFVFGRWQHRPADMGFINHANIMVFCPALIFSALLDNPVDLIRSWPLVVAGILIIVVPGLLLALVPRPGMARPGFLVPGMFRNTGNIGIPLMMLAYGQDMLGAIIVLFVLSNLLHFSLGLFLLSRGQSRWLWLRNPNIWAAVLGLVAAPYRAWLPEFVTTTVDLTGQIAIPLMLFGLGVRLSQDRIEHLGLALRVNGLYLAAGLVTLPLVLWLLPLTPAWARLVALSALLPPAVLNYLLCEQYRVEPRTVAGVVLLGNILSIGTLPLVVWATLTWL